jgi:hypothetical protein
VRPIDDEKTDDFVKGVSRGEGFAACADICFAIFC